MKKNSFVLLLIVIISFCLNFINNDFQLGYHVDELKKVSFIAENRQDFKHPILLLQIPRLLNLFLGFEHPDDIARLGRTCSALYGAGIVFATFLIARRFLKGSWPLVTAFVIALSPIMVIHAHYIKEDMLLTLTLLLTFWAAMRYNEERSFKNLLLLGLFLGLTVSSKYVGALMIPCAVPLVRKRMGFLLLTTLTCFLAINYPLLTEFSLFEEGLNCEINHALVGHNHRGIFIPIYASEYWLGFHYRYSLIPGMTLFFTLAATGGLLLYLKKGRALSLPEKALLFCPLFFYFVTELSPLKAFPDYMRYVIPTIPFLVIFAIHFWMRCTARLRLLHPVFVLGLAYMAWDSAHLVYYLNKDTRALATEWVREHPGKCNGDQYALVKRGLPCVSALDCAEERQKGIEYLLSTSFFYDRYTFAAKLKHREKVVEHTQKIYNELFALPYIEIKPAYKSFAFSNPTIRIIHIALSPPPLFLVSSDH